MKFLVTYQTDHKKFDEWMNMSEEERHAQNPQLQTAWNTWMEEHKSALIETAGVGRPKRVTATGTKDSRNDIMIYSLVEAESVEAASDMFKNHPHLGMLDGWIEIMSVNDIS